MRKRHLLLALLLGACAGVLPAIASSETTPTVNATGGGYGTGTPVAWSPPQVTIGAGGTVVFANKSSEVPHGIIWTSAAKPSCEEGPGKVPVGAEHFGYQWSGSCTFSQAGTYEYECAVHRREMTGSITVTAAGTTTTGTTPPTPSTTTSTTTTTSGPTTTTAPLGPVLLPAVQRGVLVHGSASVGDAHSRLEVDLLASSASLASAGRGRVLAGRLLQPSVGPGKVSFKAPLNARARRALRRRHRLPLLVRIVVTPPGGHPVSATRTLLLRR